MIVHRFIAAPSQERARALEQFEEQFRYPLGPGRSFRISHGEDYPRFFRAMGEGACFVAESEGRIAGVIGAALRQLAFPDGERRLVLYVGDLKTDPSARSGRTLLRLRDGVRQWVGSRADAAISVVMDGTPITPTRYTGRLGIPVFDELGKIMVLRLSTQEAHAEPGEEWVTSAQSGNGCYARLSAGRYASPGGNIAERSEMEPLWLVEPGGEACGRLEDTRRAKRLIADDGVEMRSAHLSCFAFKNPRAGAELLRVALHHTASRGLPALFVAVATPESEGISRLLEGIEVVLAPATVYGTGLAPGAIWNINTAEI